MCSLAFGSLATLTVIDFEHLWSSRSDEHVNPARVGTVFQTAVPPCFIKSRDFVPGYSRCARYCLPDKTGCYWNASLQQPSLSITYMHYLHKCPFLLLMITMNHASKIWLEANTEQSESNPGRSLGIRYNKKVAVWKTVPPKTCYSSCLSTSKIDKRWKKNESSEWIVSPFCWLLTVVNTFSALFQEKYFLSFVIPPFHLGVTTVLIVNALCVVELVVELGWNYMKFHP